MDSLRGFAVLVAAVALAGATACGVTPSNAQQRAALADPFPDLVFGSVDEFPVGQLTEVDAPRPVFVVWIDGELTVLHRKDPNNGCRLQLADEVGAPSAADVPVTAVFWDPCHGEAYDAEGWPLVRPDSTPMRRLPVEVRDGQVLLPQ